MWVIWFIHGNVNAAIAALGNAIRNQAALGNVTLTSG